MLLFIKLISEQWQTTGNHVEYFLQIIEKYEILIGKVYTIAIIMLSDLTVA